jgi:hypothetical protein
MAAGSTLYGLVAGAGSSPAQFGTIDLSTGIFTQIGNASLSKGYYAPVYDPTRNVFYVTDTPVNSAAFSSIVDVIDAATGTLTQPSLQGQVINGLGVNSSGQLFGLVAGPGSSPALFGSINLSTGTFTQIGNASVQKGYYAPVYDPTHNVFYMTDTPVNDAAFSGIIDVIDAATGALTQSSLQGQVINGLGVNGSGQLFGLVAGPGSSPAQFGTIDLSTGIFTQIGNASVQKGYYAPVYDPTRNVFYMTDTPVNDAAFSGIIDVIDAATGALTQPSLQSQVINGLGVGASSTQVAVPEPGSLLQLLTYLFGFSAAAACRSTRRGGSLRLR